MKANISNSLSILFLFTGILVGQINRTAAVENNLTETRDIIFTDSLVEKHNILDRMKHYKVPSVSVAVIDGGRIEWVKPYGYADVKGKRPADTSTLYQVASISKSVNSFGIMRLVESGRLSLTEDIRKYLKTWEFPDNELSNGKNITLINLLSHTAGLSVRGFIGYSTSDSIPTINQILDGKRPANNDPVKPIIRPGEQYGYSGGGSVVIRKILDDNISANYDSLMDEIVLKPLKMGNSTFTQPLSPRYKNYAYAYDKNMEQIKGNYFIYPEKTAGGLWSTAADIAKFVLAVQHSLKENNSGILKKQLAAIMLTPVLEQYALGFGVMEKGGEKYFWHEGESNGYRSMYYGSFTTGRGVVILTNAYPDNGKPFVYEILNSVASVYQWKDFYKPIVKTLTIVPDSLLDKYAGDYYCENPQMKISIVKKNNSLQLTARRSEEMYATGFNTFFLSSSPNDNCIFSSSNNDNYYDTFEVLQGSKSVIKAKRK